MTAKTSAQIEKAQKNLEKARTRMSLAATNEGVTEAMNDITYFRRLIRELHARLN